MRRGRKLCRDEIPSAEYVPRRFAGIQSVKMSGGFFSFFLVHFYFYCWNCTRTTTTITTTVVTTTITTALPACTRLARRRTYCMHCPEGRSARAYRFSPGRYQLLPSPPRLPVRLSVGLYAPFALSPSPALILYVLSFSLSLTLFPIFLSPFLSLAPD